MRGILLLTDMSDSFHKFKERRGLGLSIGSMLLSIDFSYIV